MRDPKGKLDEVGAALHAGDRDAVMSCFAADATLEVISGEDRTTFTGPQISDAVDLLLTGFDNLKLTPISRVVSDAHTLEESVVSGHHGGKFAGAEPTGRRVFVNVSLTATWGPDSTLESLWVEADVRALFAQITETDDHVGVTSGLSAIARERGGGALRITDETISSPAPTGGSGDTGQSSGIRRRWYLGVAAALVLLTAATVRLATSPEGIPDAQAALTPTATPTRSASTKVPAPKPSRTKPGKIRQPARTARPVIATAAPKAVPRVQRGKQLVLKSDVLFAVDSSALTPAATAAVTRVAKQIRDNKVAGTIQINGYTDNRGGVAYDIALSRARALAVARVLQGALVGQRVALVPQGFGQSNPVAANTSDVGRARNRRVTIVLPLAR